MISEHPHTFYFYKITFNGATKKAGNAKLAKHIISIASENTDTAFASNVTKRSTGHKALPVTPLRKSEEEESNSSDDDLHSLPDISTYKNDREEELLKEIAHLKLELEKAHNEIENLNMGNTKLEKQILEKETLTVKWKKLFTEAMSTPNKRASLTKRNTTEKKKDKKFGQSRSIELDESNCSAIELENTNMPIILNKSRLYNEKTKQKPKSNSIVIFSDSIGQGLASKIIEKTEFQAIYNCKRLKISKKNDTVAVLIIKYESSLYHNQQKYIKLLNDFVNQPYRKFNMIITGLRYNSKNDNEIYHINNQIFNIAKVSENIKFLDSNMIKKIQGTINY
ncbi:unnamed protein product [Parnassius apollo]|uniref:(apollo) hypothetical protein n=1 Tax=Parnassius apollo TaxID=110799 RepID=A0A8S3W7U9_PARAO|nr:unnamed protein product [Parnassius apollo]